MSVQKLSLCCLLIAVLIPLAGNAQQPTPADPTVKRENGDVSANRKALEQKLDRLLKEIDDLRQALRDESGAGRLLGPLVPVPKAPTSPSPSFEAETHSELDELRVTMNRMVVDVEKLKADFDRMVKEAYGTRSEKPPPPASLSPILWVENQTGTEQELYVNNVLYRIGARQHVPLTVSGSRIVYQLWPYERPMSMEFGPSDRERRLIIQPNPRGLGSLWSVNLGATR